MPELVFYHTLRPPGSKSAGARILPYFVAPKAPEHVFYHTFRTPRQPGSQSTYFTILCDPRSETRQITARAGTRILRYFVAKPREPGAPEHVFYHALRPPGAPEHVFYHTLRLSGAPEHVFYHTLRPRSTSSTGACILRYFATPMNAGTRILPYFATPLGGATTRGATGQMNSHRSRLKHHFLAFLIHFYRVLPMKMKASKTR